MRFVRPIPVALVLCCISHPAVAQDWARFVSPEEGFSANYPGKPTIETTTYQSEYRQTLPAKVYKAADALGRVHGASRCRRRRAVTDAVASTTRPDSTSRAAARKSCASPCRAR